MITTLLGHELEGMPQSQYLRLVERAKDKQRVPPNDIKWLEQNIYTSNCKFCPYLSPISLYPNITENYLASHQKENHPLRYAWAHMQGKLHA